MSVRPGPVGRRALIDRRLTARVSATRPFLVTAVALGIASTVLIVVQAVLLASVVDRALFHRASLHQVIPSLIGLAGAFAGRAALGWVGQFAAHRTSETVTATLRGQLLRQALALGPSWLSGERTGELSLTATRGVDALEGYFARYLPQAILAALAPIGLLIWVASQDWLSGLILLALGAVIPPAMIYFGREATKKTARQWRRLASLSGRFLELIQGLPTLRAFGQTAQGRREVEAATEGLRAATVATLRVAFLSSMALEALSGLGTGLVAMALGLRLLGGTAAFPTALAIVMVSPEVFLPLRRAAAEFHASAEGQTAAERILDLLEEPAATTPLAGLGGDLPDLRHEPLHFRSLTVAYRGRTGPVLDRLNLTVEPGEHLALIGPSGAGKSTLLGVLLGFVTPSDGRVLVGQVDLSCLDPTAWRRQVAFVPQHPYLFRGTFADNLRIGNPHANEGELHMVAELAGIGELIERLPSGFDSEIGEGGCTLSAGERQRLAIARALLHGGSLVLFDEPVAHVDPAAADELRDQLTPWLEERTVIIASHRPERIGRIDRVVDLSARPGPPSEIAPASTVLGSG